MKLRLSLILLFTLTLTNIFAQNYHARNHTSTIELADIAKQAQPKLVVLYHILFWDATDEDIIS